MKKINLKGISEILSEKELKNVMGGSVGGGGMDNRQVMPDNQVVLGGDGSGATVKPCPINGCQGPNGTHIGGGLCCLLPCYGWQHEYGYGIVFGMSRCPY